MAIVYHSTMLNARSVPFKYTDTRVRLEEDFHATLIARENDDEIFALGHHNLQEDFDDFLSYASRVADLASFIGECERNGRRPERVRIVEREHIERALRTASYAPEGLPL